jgi:anti-sigma factor RsiW
MSDHLSASILNALADGELTADQLAIANEHLAGCPACTSSALYQSLLKSSIAKAGQRYAPPAELQERLTQLVSQSKSKPRDLGALGADPSPVPSWKRPGWVGWATAAALILAAFAGMVAVQYTTRRADIASAEKAELITEVFDQHVATLASSQPPQVLSTDRHTVKPWFQGKIPFSFNLPENLPRETTLDGANLAYMHDQPVAQLLYSIGKHRVSVFVRERPSLPGTALPLEEHAGFHVLGFSTGDLEVVAVSDVDPARLADLIFAIRQAQS